jgi:hypothetical protein
MDLTIEQRIYCAEECPIGKAKKKELLNTHDSVYDAAIELDNFVEICKQTCKECL